MSKYIYSIPKIAANQSNPSIQEVHDDDTNNNDTPNEIGLKINNGQENFAEDLKQPISSLKYRQVESKDSTTVIGSNNTKQYVKDSIISQAFLNNITDENSEIEDYRIVQQCEQSKLKCKIKKKIINPIHQVEFSYQTFVEFFIYHFMYFFMFGPFIFIISPFCGKPVLQNMQFIVFNIGSIFQAIQYFLVISSYSLYYIFQTPNIHYIELYMITIALLIRCSIIASKYACSSSVYIHLIKTRVLNQEDLQKEMLLLAWASQTDDIIDEELQAAIFRENIDHSFFYFTFLKKIDPDLRKVLLLANETGFSYGLEGDGGDGGDGVDGAADGGDGVDGGHDGSGDGGDGDNGDRHSGNSPNENRRNSQDESNKQELKGNQANGEKKALNAKGEDIENVGKMEKEKEGIVSELKNKNRLRDIVHARVMKKAKGKVDCKQRVKVNSPTEVLKILFAKILAKDSKLKNEKLSGYNLTKHIIQNSRPIKVPFEYGITLSIAIFRTFIPVFYRVYKSKPAFGEHPIEIVLITCFIMINSFFFWVNYAIIFRNIVDLKRKLYMMGQLTTLLAINKQMVTHVPINYPSINIFDTVSIKTWSNMRKIYMAYGQKFHQRNSFNIALYLCIYSTIVVFLSLHFLKLSSLYYDPLILLVCGFESIAIFAIFGCMLCLGARLNNHFKIHRSYLKKNKTVISDLLRMQDLYFSEDDGVIPDDQLYRRGVKILKNKFLANKETHDRNHKELTYYLNQLHCMFNDIIEELTYEELNNPYSILGFTIDDGLIQKTLMGLFSLIIAIVQITVFG